MDGSVMISPSLEEVKSERSQITGSNVQRKALGGEQGRRLTEERRRNVVGIRDEVNDDNLARIRRVRMNARMFARIFARKLSGFTTISSDFRRFRDMNYHLHFFQAKATGDEIEDVLGGLHVGEESSPASKLPEEADVVGLAEIIDGREAPGGDGDAREPEAMVGGDSGGEAEGADLGGPSRPTATTIERNRGRRTFLGIDIGSKRKTTGPPNYSNTTSRNEKVEKKPAEALFKKSLKKPKATLKPKPALRASAAKGKAAEVDPENESDSDEDVDTEGMTVGDFREMASEILDLVRVTTNRRTGRNPSSRGKVEKAIKAIRGEVERFQSRGAGIKRKVADPKKGTESIPKKAKVTARTREKGKLRARARLLRL
ncbi:uncharacterized protein BDR25DRAFT_317352 [Lindgomyces ingoldianus]|uniref:Uncharacterized protein n=1 Tax=Lindgomyces ingoldianus TaxID=673940 RepID=A0ACB6QKK7_9PLEO|nr:uncharacterized protein BDR25DRAFT_317352 [Lindgomyces ingoldianus]KAF2466670.1 hypothetical protein BDR25DRAFT_317352 [Lindgomyces ingoldianus]